MDTTRLQEGGASRELTRVEVPARDAVFGEFPSLNPQRFLRMLRRRQRLILAVALSITLAAVAYSLLRRPVYEAEAVLFMSPTEPSVASTSEQPASQRPDSSFVDSQVEILRSPALALQLVDRLGLASDPEWSRGGSRMGAARAVASAIRAERRGSTYVVEVGVRSRDPSKATLMANTLVELYFASRETARQQEAMRSGSWLSERMNQLREEVRAREDEVEAYRAENGLLTVEGAMLAEQEVRSAEDSLVAARADLAEREARYRHVAQIARSGGPVDTVAGALNSDVMVQLRARQADLNARVADYSGRYNDSHPALQTARAELADIERQIAAEVGRQAQALRNEADISRARLASLQGHLAQVRQALIGSNAEQVRLRELERNAAAARTVYEAFLTRYHLVSDSAGRGGDAQVVSEAMEPNAPVSRPWLAFALMASVLGFLAGILAAFIAEQFDTRLQSAEDIEEKTGAEMLTSIPTLKRTDFARLSAPDRHPAGYVAAKPLSAFAEAIRVLRVRILHAGWSAKKVVAVTSALPGEGKTSVALCLARVCALSGQRVILIDCDLRRRSLNHLLGVDPQRGLVQVLRGEIPWQSAVGVDEGSGAHILPAAQEELHTIEDICGSPAMKQLLETLAREHDMVILDCAPVLTLADVRDLASVADGVVMVARRGKTEAAALQTALSELKAVRASILGVALNGVDMRAPGRYSYGDPLYFSHATAGMYTL